MFILVPQLKTCEANSKLLLLGRYFVNWRLLNQNNRKCNWSGRYEEKWVFAGLTFPCWLIGLRKQRCWRFTTKRSHLVIFLGIKICNPTPQKTNVCLCFVKLILLVTVDQPSEEIKCTVCQIVYLATRRVIGEEQWHLHTLHFSLFQVWPQTFHPLILHTTNILLIMLWLAGKKIWKFIVNWMVNLMEWHMTSEF